MKKFWIATTVTVLGLIVISHYSPIESQTPNPTIISASPLSGPCPPRRYNVATGSISFKFCDLSTNTWALPASSGGPPTGAAGGDLSGTYPNPTVAKINGIGVPQFSQATSVTVTGVTVATTLISSTNAIGSLTLPANFFNVSGSFLHIKWQGTWNQGGTATADDVYNITLGGTAVAQGTGDALFAATASTNRCSLDLILTAQTVGASVALTGNSGMSCDTPGGASVNPVWIPFANTANTINTTGTLLFNMTVTPGATAHTIVATNVVLENF